jgi:hypothetical protein
MSKVYNRGQKIVFRHAFRNTASVITTGLTTAATLRLSYPLEGWPFRGLTESTTITMVESTLAEGSTDPDYATWSATWASANAYPGPVQYQIRPSNLVLDIEEGELTLRGNPANLTVTTTTE